MGESIRIQNRRENKAGPFRNSFDEAKGRERTEKVVRDRNKTVHFYFFGVAVLCS
jgi:hypothetical protein